MRATSPFLSSLGSKSVLFISEYSSIFSVGISDVYVSSQYQLVASESLISPYGLFPLAAFTLSFEGLRLCISLFIGSVPSKRLCGQICSALIPPKYNSVLGSTPSGSSTAKSV